MILNLKIEPSLFDKGLEAMKKALKSVDENAVLSINDEYLSQSDKESLKQTYELVKAGKMEFLSDEQLSANLAKKGYEW